ncbi:MAG: hypothetical protein KC502_08280 [Myxococcales bacterium]|nr:hypothetical protein [Myxococcales bacterium]
MSAQDSPPNGNAPCLHAPLPAARAAVLVMLAVLMAAGCGGGAQPIALKPIVFKVRTTPSGRRVYVRDFEVLRSDAVAAFKDKRWKEAVELFDIIASEYPDHEGMGAVRYNAGLGLMRLGRYKEASDRFRHAARHGAGSRDARDAVFVLAESLHYRKRYVQAGAVYGAMLTDPDVIRLIGGELGVLDHLEAVTRQGLNLKLAGKIHAADKAFRKTQRLYDRHRDLRPVATSHWVPLAYYQRGEIYRELFETIRFKLPVARMRRDLEDKANLFLKAQSSYFRAVRLHHPKWSLAAGYRIGNLYARLIDDIYKAEVPDGLDELTKQAYKDELLKHTGHLAKRAVVIFEKNIALASRIGAGGAWISKSKAQLSRMKALLRQDARRKGQSKDPTKYKMKVVP